MADNFTQGRKYYSERYGRRSNACICRVFRSSCRKPYGLCDFALKHHRWLDHVYGMFYKNGVYTLVCEPYALDGHTIETLADLRRNYPVEISIGGHAQQWAPGHTIPIIIQSKCAPA